MPWRPRLGPRPVIAPRGDPRELEFQLIRVGDLVRGRALFHHPNKLAEFLEQLGLWLAAVGMGGVSPAVSAITSA